MHQGMSAEEFARQELEQAIGAAYHEFIRYPVRTTKEVKHIITKLLKKEKSDGATTQRRSGKRIAKKTTRTAGNNKKNLPKSRPTIIAKRRLLAYEISLCSLQADLS